MNDTPLKFVFKITVIGDGGVGKTSLIKKYTQGTFEEDYFSGLKWKKQVETVSLPFIQDLKVVYVEVEWGRNKSYSLQTIISKY